MMNKIAQIELAPDGGYKGFGPLGLENRQSPVGVFSTFLSSAIGLITIIGIIRFTFTIIMGAVGIITSGGDKASNESARKKITSGIIGLVVLVAGIFIVNLIGTLIGIPTILNIGGFINQITVK